MVTVVAVAVLTSVPSVARTHTSCAPVSVQSKLTDDANPLVASVFDTSKEDTVKQSPVDEVVMLAPLVPAVTVALPATSRSTVGALAVTAMFVHSSTSHKPLSFSSTHTLKSSKE